MALDSLTDLEQQMLDLETLWWARPAVKEAAIADRFGMSAVRYYQLLTPKSRAGGRVLPLPDQLVAAFKAARPNAEGRRCAARPAAGRPPHVRNVDAPQGRADRGDLGVAGALVEGIHDADVRPFPA